VQADTLKSCSFIAFQWREVGPYSLNIITVKKVVLPWRLVKHGEVLMLDDRTMGENQVLCFLLHQRLVNGDIYIYIYDIFSWSTRNNSMV